MSKITTEHLSRGAFVYIRQSTADRLAHNHESRRRQYGLADRAKHLGWSTVEVIDDDLGRSGGGIVRPGFERLLAAICAGTVGAVLAIEASRLARNGRDWHTLIEFCGLVGTIIVDEDGIYDPRHPNDRLLLGMKGTMSELELSLFRQRSQEALKQKARRGALADNATGMTSAVARGAAREGELLVPGLLRCGHCGRKLHVHYGGKLGRYNCYGARANHGTERCISVSGLSIDAAIAGEVLRELRPLGVEAALKAIEAQSSQTTVAERQLELSLQQARYEAVHARRQYDAVDPANRLVASELERRWNEALLAVAQIEGEIAAVMARRPPPLGEVERQQLMALGTDLTQAWSHPAATATTRKRIVRAALTEIVVRRDGAIIHAILHWRGGSHTELKIKQRLNAAGRPNPHMPHDTIALMSELARLMPDQQITRLLNRIGVETGYGNAWTQERVRGFRQHHGIARYREGEWAERGEISLEEAAGIVGVCNMTALRMLRRGDIKGRQVCRGAPWVIRTADLSGFAGHKRAQRPLTPNPAQSVFNLQ